MSNCICGGPLIPVRINLVNEKKILIDTICWKLWCPKCENSQIDKNGRIIYYQMLGGGKFTTDPIEFWSPESVKFQNKLKFIESVLSLANKNKFEGHQYYTMRDIREQYIDENKDVKGGNK